MMMGFAPLDLADTFKESDCGKQGWKLLSEDAGHFRQQGIRQELPGKRSTQQQGKHSGISHLINASQNRFIGKSVRANIPFRMQSSKLDTSPTNCLNVLHI